MPTNNIIELDSYFNSTNKSNLTDSLFGSGLLFLGHPVYLRFPWHICWNISRRTFDQLQRPYSCWQN